MKVAVVGAGIIGASIAYHLARQGASVTVLSGGRRGGVATAASFAWINSAPGNPRPYHDLRMLAILEWHRLQSELPGAIEINWNGSLWWEEDEGVVERDTAEATSWGYPMRYVDRAEIARLEPALAQAPERAVLSMAEGSLSPVATAEVLLRAAEDLGASIVDEPATAIETAGGQATGVVTGDGRVEADAVALAAGVGCADLAETLGVALPMDNLPGFLMQSRPVAPVLNRIVLSPSTHFRQNADGRIVAGLDFGGGPPPDDQDAEARRLLDTVSALLGHKVALEVDRHSLGMRPIPADGLPVIGHAPSIEGLYLGVMHSGVTLAALAGRMAAQEIMGGPPVDALSIVRPARFAG